MSDQRELDFDDTPRARNADPASSHRAADESAPNLGGQRLRVLRAVIAHPGRTARELSEISGIELATCHKRMPELEHRGFVERVGIGNRDLKCFATEKGRGIA